MKALLLKDWYVLRKQAWAYLIIVLVWVAIPSEVLNLLAVVYGAMIPYTAMAYAQRGKVGGRLVALAFQIGKSKYFFFVLVVGPYQRHLVRLLFGPHVHHVVGEVKVLGNVEMQMLSEVLL